MKGPWEYYDYGYDPYIPITSGRKKFSSDVLLRNSLLQSVYQKSFLSIVKEIRDAIGPWKTVWGVKLDGSIVTWELYFYSYRNKDWRRTLTSLSRVLRLYFKIPAFVEMSLECQPYFMFSVDLSDDIFRSKKIDSVHLYMYGRLGMPQGNSYFCDHEGMHFENHYNFFRMPQEIRQFIHQVKYSVVLGQDSVSFLKHGLVRQLMPCYRICVAHKKDKEGIYFSRVNVVQLLYFLEHFSYPGHIVDFIRYHKEKLGHLLYDVAFDCTLGPQGPIFGKSSYYGVF